MTGEDKKRVQILAISIDTREDSKRFVKELNERFPGSLDFPLLEDREHRVIDRYGLLNPHSRGLPHPATYVIDKERRVRWRFVEVDYTQRPSNEEILRALREIP